MNTKKWKKINAKGENPKELCYASGWYDPPHFFFYGGRNKESTLSEIHFLNTNNWIWKRISTLDKPISRFYHAGAKTNKTEYYIYGGINIGRENRLLNDMWKYEYCIYYIIYL